MYCTYYHLGPGLTETTTSLISSWNLFCLTRSRRLGWRSQVLLTMSKTILLFKMRTEYFKRKRLNKFNRTTEKRQSDHYSMLTELRVEKRAMSIICPGLPYQETIELVNIVPIVDFITGLSSNTFDTIIKNPEHRLNRLIQFSGPSRYSLRCNRRFIVPKCKIDRFRNSFIIRSCIDNIYT